jgi:uncharacterized protein (TIGR02996 family)
MIVGIVILSVVVAGAICFIGRNHMIQVAPGGTFDLVRARRRIRPPLPRPIFVPPEPQSVAQRQVWPAEPQSVEAWLTKSWITKSWTVALANDRDEQRMLSELRANPGDALMRMVYGDWLEDRGELARAAFVRGTEVLSDQHAIVETTSLAWRAVTSQERVACAGLRCARRWDALEPIDDDELARYCPYCGKTARYLDDLGKIGSCQVLGEIPVLDVACTLATPARATFPFDLSSL